MSHALIHPRNSTNRPTHTNRGVYRKCCRMMHIPKLSMTSPLYFMVGTLLTESSTHCPKEVICKPIGRCQDMLCFHCIASHPHSCSTESPNSTCRQYFKPTGRIEYIFPICTVPQERSLHTVVFCDSPVHNTLTLPSCSQVTHACGQ